MERGTLLSPPAEKPEKRPPPIPAISLEAPPHVGRAAHAAPHGAPPTGHEDQIDLNVPEPRPVWVVVVGVAVVAVLATLLITGLVPREHLKKELDEAAANARTAPVLVDVTHPKLRPADDRISMPATLRPWQEVSIQARTTGYLKHYNVDISDQVKAGQVMAEINAPELDQQLLQAKAAVKQAEAAVLQATTSRKLAQVTFERYQQLFASKSTTPQDLDEKQSAKDAAEAAVEAAKANVGAAEANVRRLTEMQQFEKVVAPFDGVVTGRAYDVGSLILADPSNIDIKPMYKIAENDVLRVFVNVPQSAALQITKGMEVHVTARERPDQVFTGKVMGTTNYLDPANRTLLTEVKVFNAPRPDGSYTLLPGMYVTVDFVVHREKPPLVIPAPSLVTGANGTQVAVVENGVAHFKTVKLGEDYGSEVEVVGGLSQQDAVITTPGERVVEGVAVRVDKKDEPAKAEPAKAESAKVEKAEASTAPSLAAPRHQEAKAEAAPATQPSGK